jgi:hypothetical protein
MAILIGWGTVCLSMWVPCVLVSLVQTLNLYLNQLTVGPSGRASVGVVTKGVDVDATLSIGIVTSDIPCDSGWGGLGCLLEGNGSGDLRVTSDGCNYNSPAT